MARQTSLSNYIKRVRTESPDAAGPATAPAPARQAVGLAWEEGPIGGQEGAASQSSSAGSLAPVDLSAIDEPAAQPKLKKYPITVFGHKDRSFSSHCQRHARFLGAQKEMHPDRRALELERGCDT
ncbi:unnamed protein product, partial [Arctogadus glacialis]